MEIPSQSPFASYYSHIRNSLAAASIPVGGESASSTGETLAPSRAASGGGGSTTAPGAPLLSSATVGALIAQVQADQGDSAGTAGGAIPSAAKASPSAATDPVVNSKFPGWKVLTSDDFGLISATTGDSLVKEANGLYQVKDAQGDVVTDKHDMLQVMDMALNIAGGRSFGTITGPISASDFATIVASMGNTDYALSQSQIAAGYQYLESREQAQPQSSASTSSLNPSDQAMNQWTASDDAFLSATTGYHLVTDSYGAQTFVDASGNPAPPSLADALNQLVFSVKGARYEGVLSGDITQQDFDEFVQTAAGSASQFPKSWIDAASAFFKTPADQASPIASNAAIS